jgi:hypothetical protein
MAERPMPREAFSWVEKLRNGEWYGLTSRSLRTEVDEALNLLKRRPFADQGKTRPPHSTLRAGVGVDGARAFH